MKGKARQGKASSASPALLVCVLFPQSFTLSSHTWGLSSNSTCRHRLYSTMHPTKVVFQNHDRTDGLRLKLARRMVMVSWSWKTFVQWQQQSLEIYKQKNEDKVKGYEPRMQRTSQARQYKLGQSSCWLLHHLSRSLTMALMPCTHVEYCLCVVMMRAFA